MQQGERTGRPQSSTPSRAEVAAVLEDPQRLAALREANLLDLAPDTALDRLSRLAADSLGVPLAVISVIDERDCHWKGAHGWPEPWASQRRFPASDSFCQYVLYLREPLVVGDTRRHVLVGECPAIERLGAAAYAGHPLTLNGEHIFGTLAVLDRQPHTWEDRDLALLHDLADAATDSVAARQDAVRTRAAAQHELDAQRDELLTLLSHELRTPLTSLKMQTQLTTRHLVATGALATQLERMQRAVGRMERLVESVVEASRIQAHELPLEVETCDLQRFCATVVEEHREASGRDIEVELPEQPCPVRCDADRLEQVLANLLSNALKYSPPNRTVRLELRCTGDQAQVAVRDQGPGIPREALAHLFDRFYRAPQVEVQSGSHLGLGLGLYISRQIIERHGGRMWVESEVGRGSTFAFVLPLDRSVAAS